MINDFPLNREQGGHAYVWSGVSLLTFWTNSIPGYSEAAVRSVIVPFEVTPDMVLDRHDGLHLTEDNAYILGAVIKAIRDDKAPWDARDYGDLARSAQVLVQRSQECISIQWRDDVILFDEDPAEYEVVLLTVDDASQLSRRLRGAESATQRPRPTSVVSTPPFQMSDAEREDGWQRARDMMNDTEYDFYHS